jgi:hypothetical protein
MTRINYVRPSNIQGNSGEHVSILGDDIIGHRQKKEGYMNTCLTVNGYQDRAV